MISSVSSLKERGRVKRPVCRFLSGFPVVARMPDRPAGFVGTHTSSRMLLTF